MSSRSEPVTVIPSPDLLARPDGSYVRGVPAEGIALPAEEAERLIAAGLVIRKPEPKPAGKETD